MQHACVVFWKKYWNERKKKQCIQIEMQKKAYNNSRIKGKAVEFKTKKSTK